MNETLIDMQTNLMEDSIPSIGYVSFTGALMPSIYSSLMDAVPYLWAFLFLLVADTVYGIRYSIIRKEKVTMKKFLQKTITKVIGYTTWVLIGTTLAYAFHAEVVQYTIIGCVCAVELSGTLDNYFHSKGKDNPFDLIGTIAEKFSVKLKDKEEAKEDNEE